MDILLIPPFAAGVSIETFFFTAVTCSLPLSSNGTGKADLYYLQESDTTGCYMEFSVHLSSDGD